ncbi:AI-2E family transporter [uncultured Thiothrix sp.]|uniref:AI-2E family transporter n=1 Tax=uncultured Thiothrix sp. TaxID=223185 RepID=UPI0026328D89|nr:AI-2E family transporter [uncultured Thiothrix sp.]
MDSKIWFWLVVLTIATTLFYLLSPMLTPFFVAALLAYLGDPLVDRLENMKLSRTLSVTVVFVVISLIILIFFLFLVPLLEMQIKHLGEKLPGYLDWSLSMFGTYLQAQLGVDPAILQGEKLKELVASNWQQTGGLIKNVLQTLSKSGFMVVGWLGTLALIPVLLFYLLRDWDNLVAYIHDLLPRSVEPTVSRLAKESDEMLGAFLRGQFMVMIALSILYWLGLSLIGLDFALLIGFIAGLVSFVPYLGLIVGITIAGIAILFQTQDPLNLLWILGVFVVVQVIEGSVLTPWLVGERIGLHPVAVIFAVLAGGQLFGFVGVLLALPVAAILVVIMRHLHETYKQSNVYTDASPP